ncbi:MAG: hypothetical protein Q8933_07485 [Bacteroidota bacterium]|nr:hypothetical protein [Bacteroidota bacterium]MDP4194460.1 hypothetical protein [Bacteroidota bacterium]
MLHKVSCNAFLIIFIVISSLKMSPQTLDQTKSTKPWKGNAILGNGNICVVYSDDRRISSETKSKGIQHFYYKDYTADYIKGSEFEIITDKPEILSKAKNAGNTTEIGIENSFCAFTKTMFQSGLTSITKCFVHPKDAAILTLNTTGSSKQPSYKFQLFLRKEIVTDRKIALVSLKKQRNSAVAEWSNKTILIISPRSSKDILEVDDSVVTVYGKAVQKGKSEIIITAGNKTEEIFSRINALKSEQDLYNSASEFWDKWLSSGLSPKFKDPTEESARYTDYYRRTLYSVKAATLRGMVPADITGQFVTNNMPQLYPRDAMMCARVFLLTGHSEEAKEIIEFWAKPGIPKKAKGEFYARYDAFANAVDAGSGARYDEPEWDANGYFIQLVSQYYKEKKAWLVDKSFIYELADFLVSHIDKSGLLYEGGIVEWTGYLPSTNMTCAAALKTASEIAESLGDKSKARSYLEASETITRSISKTFNTSRQALSDLRFHGIKAEGNKSVTEPTKDTLYLWDTSLNFGVIWGFPNTELLEKTNRFIEENNVKLGGGVQYFEAKDNAGLSSYGGDLFFFTTSAAAQYQSLYGNNLVAKKHIDWMIENSNIYGLMPERIYLNQTDCSPASPLSWCSAEFAASILEWSRKFK